jgi:hypothetical protein
MNRVKKFPWRFLWSIDKNGLVENSKVDDILNSVTFLRAKILADIESVRAKVDGEDLWFTCYQRKKESSLNGEKK